MDLLNDIMYLLMVGGPIAVIVTILLTTLMMACSHEEGECKCEECKCKGEEGEEKGEEGEEEEKGECEEEKCEEGEGEEKGECEDEGKCEGECEGECDGEEEKEERGCEEKCECADEGEEEKCEEKCEEDDLEDRIIQDMIEEIRRQRNNRSEAVLDIPTLPLPQLASLQEIFSRQLLSNDTVDRASDVVMGASDELRQKLILLQKDDRRKDAVNKMFDILNMSFSKALTAVDREFKGVKERLDVSLSNRQEPIEQSEENPECVAEENETY